MSCARSTASDQVASMEDGQPLMAEPAVACFRSAYSTRYSRAVVSLSMICAAACARC